MHKHVSINVQVILTVSVVRSCFMKSFSFSSLAVQPPEGSAATVLLTNLLPLIPSAVPLLRALTVFTLITVGANDNRLLWDNLVNIAYILLIYLFFFLSSLYKLNENPHRLSPIAD